MGDVGLDGCTWLLLRSESDVGSDVLHRVPECVADSGQFLFVFGQPETWGTAGTESVSDTRLYGTAKARSWDRLHPRLTHRSSWATADGTLPVVEGTVIRLDIDQPSGATPKPVWLWWAGTDATPADADRL